MRNQNKIDPIVLATTRKAASSQNKKVLHLSLTVGKRVVAHKAIKPSTQAEYIRLKSNRGFEEGLDAVSGKILNSEEGCYGEICLDGRMIHYGIEKFGRNVNYAWLRINNRPYCKVYSEEGIKNLLN